jgi:hypothetical protein
VDVSLEKNARGKREVGARFSVGRKLKVQEFKSRDKLVLPVASTGWGMKEKRGRRWRAGHGCFADP